MDVVEDRSDELIVVAHGGGKGRTASLKNLTSCTVILCDVYAQVTVDAVQGCRLFIGPTSGSVFLRGPVACHITVAAKQLRVRDAVGCTIAAHTPSAPAIESSCGLHFLPFNGAYPGIDAHFEAAELDPTSNAWSQVYDFSEDDRSLPAPHWQPLSFTSWEGSDGCPSPAAQLAVGYIFDRFDTDGDGVWGAEDFAAYAAALEEEPVPGEHLAALLQSLPPVASEVLGGWGVSAPGGGEVWPEVGQHAVTSAGMTMWGLVALLASEGTDAIPKAAQALGMDPRHALTDWIVRGAVLARAGLIAAPSALPTFSPGTSSGSAGAPEQQEDARHTEGSGSPASAAGPTDSPPRFTSPAPSAVSTLAGTDGDDDDGNISTASQAATDALLASMAAQLPWDVLVAVTVSGAAASPLPLPLEDAPAVATFVAFALAQSLAKASSSAKADHMTGQDLLAALRGMVVVPVAWPGQEAGPVTLPLPEGALQDTLRLVGSGSTEDRGGPAELAALVPIQMLVALVRIRLQGDLEARGLAGPLPVTTPGLTWRALLTAKYEAAPTAPSTPGASQAPERDGDKPAADAESDGKSDTGAAPPAPFSHSPPSSRLPVRASPPSSKGQSLGRGLGNVRGRGSGVAVSAVLPLSPVPQSFRQAYHAEAFNDGSAAVVPSSRPASPEAPPSSNASPQKSPEAGSFDYERPEFMDPGSARRRAPGEGGEVEDPVQLADAVIAEWMSALRRAPDVYTRMRQAVLAADSVPAAHLSLHARGSAKEQTASPGSASGASTAASPDVPSSLPRRTTVKGGAGKAARGGPRTTSSPASTKSGGPRRSAAAHTAAITRQLGVDLVGAHTVGRLLRSFIDPHVPDALAIIILLRLGGSPAQHTVTERSGYPSFMAGTAWQPIDPAGPSAGPTLTTRSYATAVLPRERLLHTLQRMRRGPNARPQQTWAAEKRREAAVALSAAAQRFEAALEGDVPSEADVASGRAGWLTHKQVLGIVKRFRFMSDESIHTEALAKAADYGSTGAARTAARRLLNHARQGTLTPEEEGDIQATFGDADSQEVEGGGSSSDEEDAYSVDPEHEVEAGGAGPAAKVRSLKHALAVVVAKAARAEERRLRDDPEASAALFWEYVAAARSGSALAGFDAWAADRATAREARRQAVREWGARKDAEAALHAAELSQAALLFDVIDAIQDLVREDSTAEHKAAGFDISKPGRRGMRVHARLAQLRKAALARSRALGGGAAAPAGQSPAQGGGGPMSASARLEPLVRGPGDAAGHVAPIVTREDVERTLRPVLVSLLADKRTAGKARAILDARGAADRRVRALAASKGGRRRLAALAEEGGCAWEGLDEAEEEAAEAGQAPPVPEAVRGAALRSVYQRICKETFGLGSLKKGSSVAEAAAEKEAAAAAARTEAFEEFLARKASEAKKRKAAERAAAKAAAEEEAKRHQEAEAAYKQWKSAAEGGLYRSQRENGALVPRPSPAKPPAAQAAEASTAAPTHAHRATAPAVQGAAHHRPEWRDVAAEWEAEQAAAQSAAREAAIARKRPSRTHAQRGRAKQPSAGVRKVAGQKGQTRAVHASPRVRPLAAGGAKAPAARKGTRTKAVRKRSTVQASSKATRPGPSKGGKRPKRKARAGKASSAPPPAPPAVPNTVVPVSDVHGNVVWVDVASLQGAVQAPSTLYPGWSWAPPPAQHWAASPQGDVHPAGPWASAPAMVPGQSQQQESAAAKALGM